MLRVGAYPSWQWAWVMFCNCSRNLAGVPGITNYIFTVNVWMWTGTQQALPTTWGVGRTGAEIDDQLCRWCESGIHLYYWLRSPICTAVTMATMCWIAMWGFQISSSCCLFGLQLCAHSRYWLASWKALALFGLQNWSVRLLLSVEGWIGWIAMGSMVEIVEIRSGVTPSGPYQSQCSFFATGCILWGWGMGH